MIKDLAALKNSSLPQQISNLIYKVPVTSHIVEKFRTSCNFDTEITHLTESIIACLSQKFKSMQHDLNVAIIKLNQGYQASKSKQSDPKKSKPDDIVHDSNCQCHHHHHEDEEDEEQEQEEEQEHEEEEPTDPIPPPMDKGSLTEPLLAKTPPPQENFENKTDTEKNDEAQENNKETQKEDGSEQLRKFAASLMLKAEKRAKGEEKNVRDEDSPKKTRMISAKSSVAPKKRETKQSMTRFEFLKNHKAKKIKKDLDQKLGRYIGLDGQKKLLKKEKISLAKASDEEEIEPDEEEEFIEAHAPSLPKSL